MNFIIVVSLKIVCEKLFKNQIVNNKGCDYQFFFSKLNFNINFEGFTHSYSLNENNITTIEITGSLFKFKAYTFFFWSKTRQTISLRICKERAYTYLICWICMCWPRKNSFLSSTLNILFNQKTSLPFHFQCAFPLHY